MSNAWETEEDDIQESTKTAPTARPTSPPRLEYEVKAYLVLVDSDNHNDWGIIEDTLNNVNWQPGEGEIVGTWSRPQYDNLIHISLSTALSALQDRSAQTFAHYAEERRLREAGLLKPPRKGKKAVTSTEEPALVPTPDISIDEKLKFNALRARLGRSK